MRGMFKSIRTDTTLKQKTLQLLTDAILSSKIKPGERLNESEVARMLHVSRAPVREAMQQLHEQGLIVNVPRRGMFVVSLDEESIQKINSLRLLLEAEALRLARLSGNSRGKEKLERLVEKMEQTDYGPTSEVVHDDMEFHRMVWNLAGNEYLEKTLVSLTAPLFAHAMLTLLRKEKQRMLVGSHRTLLDFVLGRGRESAEEVILNHLRLGWNSPDKFSSIKESAILSASESRDMA